MANVQHTCTGCVPIDATIIDVYVQMLGTEQRAEQAAADAEHAAEYAIGKSPYIGENGDWFEWDDTEARFIDTGVQAQGQVAVDIELSLTSTNPVQNKVVTAAINEKYTKPADGIPTSDILDASLNMTQAQINQIVIGGNVNVSLAASPNPIFAGTQSTISLTASVSTSASSITIKKGDTVLATGSGTSLSATDTITPASAGNTNYTAEFAIGGLTKTASRSVSAVYPIRIGTGSSYVEGTALTTPKTSPAGTYNVTVANDGEYVYFNVPSTMSINGATMGGFEFPLEAPQNKTIGGVAYKSYASSNTYDAGTLTIVIS